MSWRDAVRTSRSPSFRHLEKTFGTSIFRAKPSHDRCLENGSATGNREECQRGSEFHRIDVTKNIDCIRTLEVLKRFDAFPEPSAQDRVR